MKSTQPHPPTVAVGMSGGVDSAVAAALLVEQGYNVIGLTIKTYNYEDVGGNIGNESSCCSIDGMIDARNTAHALGIPHYVVDLTVPFKEQVIDYFTETYLKGETPNPCVMCNRHIKWAALIKKAEALGADYIATGHYARLREENGRFIISKAKDLLKDQSYTLWNVAQEHLVRTIFPLAEFTKSETRAAAERFHLPVAQKHESFEICFVPDNNYARFLKANVEGLEEKVAHGAIMHEGKQIGEHEGFPFYTIGQRRGLSTAVGKPVFVVNIDAATNTITLGGEAELMHTTLIASQVNYMKVAAITSPMRVTVKIRAHDEGAPATVTAREDGTLEIVFDEPRKAITAGQSVVMYDGDDVVGGGVING